MVAGRKGGCVSEAHERVTVGEHWCSISREGGMYDVHFMWGGHVGFAWTRWGARWMARRHLRRVFRGHGAT